MKILHLMPNTNYIVPSSYIKFINENFKNQRHKFVFLNNDENIPAMVPRGENVSFIDEKKFVELCKSYDQVLFHSLFFSSRLKLTLMFYPEIMNKTKWVAWGADIYEWRSKNTNIFSFVKNSIYIRFANKVKYFIGIFPPDIKYFKKEFNKKATTYHSSYVGSLYDSIFSEIIETDSLYKKIEENKCINIQIGHQCNPLLNHLDVLEVLYKFRNENIKIYLPLSYGDSEYGDIVEKKAKKLFGDKAVCMRESISKQSYLEFLRDIDIAIFNTKRQIGLGNLNALLFMEKKIFMPEGSTMYDYFRSKEIEICAFDEIIEGDFSIFTNPIDKTKSKKYIVEHELNLNNKIKMWSKVFNV